MSPALFIGVKPKKRSQIPGGRLTLQTGNKFFSPPPPPIPPQSRPLA